ncbi:chemotaxis protein CheB [Alteraurantiacibacter buctensis]|uniref:protein-glutamate methylesterase n=1 Tax=Alteraurantiacibacter buctensis TaxID=1503981 RepID=A0A844YVF3_9SPHN|nr:chemotaxis protein CheB [Alteraurantiacibacter buctensis]MXO71122.1 response regulator [Alteraurantiacibacter buctensis]
MKDARVLVVDDSAAMRALFCDIPDSARNVSVVGVAASAAEARDKIRDLKPNVLTLDVEMPGMSGMDFLAELMADKPMPVVMLSSVTQMGTGTAAKAMELGAIECFPKPLHTSPEDFNATVGKLGKIVLDAANTDMEARATALAEAAANSNAAGGDFMWNGTLVALSGGNGALDVLKGLLAAYPADCPPTVVCLPDDPGQARDFVARMAPAVACGLVEAKDNAELKPGVIHVACDPACHAIVEKGTPPRLRLMARDPVGGVRPSAELLFGSLARAETPALGALLSGKGTDGARGLAMLKGTGATTMVQDPASALAGEAPHAAVAAGAGEPVPGAQLGGRIIAACNFL